MFFFEEWLQTLGFIIEHPWEINCISQDHQVPNQETELYVMCLLNPKRVKPHSRTSSRWGPQNHTLWVAYGFCTMWEGRWGWGDRDSWEHTNRRGRGCLCLETTLENVLTRWQSVERNPRRIAVLQLGERYGQEWKKEWQKQWLW